MAMDMVMLPLRTTVAFAHAAVQVVAEEAGIDLLHIKGPAVDSEAASFRGDGQRAPRPSIDADVLVRPSQVRHLMEALSDHGWTLLYDFPDGSPFEHAATLGRAGIANVDVHRLFPGIEIDPEVAFERLWIDRRETRIGSYPVSVPSLASQRLILILHAARGRSGAQMASVRAAWNGTSQTDRAAIEALAGEIRAVVALAAGTGNLDTVAGERSHRLWLALSQGERSQIAMWRARVGASTSRRAALRTAIHLLVPKRQRLAQRLGRPPTRREMASAYLIRLRRGVLAISNAIRARMGRGQ